MAEFWCGTFPFCAHTNADITFVATSAEQLTPKVSKAQIFMCLQQETDLLRFFYILKSLGPNLGPSEYSTNTLNHYNSVSVAATTTQTTTATKQVGTVVTL
jgi:hypothetical protein